MRVLTQTTPLPATLPVFVVSGGARGITAQCVINLAKALPTRWILLGRSAMMDEEPDWAKGCDDEAELKRRILQTRLDQGEKATPAAIQQIYRSLVASREISQTLKTLQEHSCDATYISVDITDAASLKAKLTPVVEQLGNITGVIHGAGNLADKRIEKKTEQDFDRVYGAKVNGLNNLLSCMAIDQLKYLVLFSSVAGFYGNAGQADYALANEILNKTALWIKQHYPTCHAVAINWGPWESGMVTPARKAAFMQRGIAVLPIESATQMLVNELSDRYQDTAQVVVGSPIPSPLVALNEGLKTYRLHRKLSLTDNPFLTDHIIAGMPVLPFTCALAWMAHATEQIYPQYRASLCEEVKLLKGIIFNDKLADNYVLELTELSKSEDEIVIASKIYSRDSSQDGSQNKKERIHYHFSSRNTLTRQRQPRPMLSSVALESSYPKSSYSTDDDALAMNYPAASGRGIKLKRALAAHPDEASDTLALALERTLLSSLRLHAYLPYWQSIHHSRTLHPIAASLHAGIA